MYKKAMSVLMLVNLLILAGFGCVSAVRAGRLCQKPAFEMRLDAVYTADHKSSTVGMVTRAASGQRVVDYGVLEKEQVCYELSRRDYELLLRIVEAEAGCEDEDGRLLVANVVLNRVESEKFPDTVSEVVLQSSKGVTQFSPVATGSIWEVEISEETVLAVQRALEGEDISEGAMYFAARRYADSDRMRWFDEELTFLFEHGGHEFFF